MLLTDDPTFRALLAALDGTDDTPPDPAAVPIAADRLEELGLLAEPRVRRLVLERPAGDGRRLLYAEERERAGDADRAEFIRVQCELAKTPETDPAWPELAAREDELVRFNAWRWIGDALPRAWQDGFGTWTRAGARITSKRSVCREIEFRRGFLWRVACPLAAWEEYGPLLVSRHPVERVDVTDGVRIDHLPDNQRSIGWFWVPLGRLGPFTQGGDRHLGRGGFLAEADARAALSRELLAWARQVAKEKGLMP